MTVKQQASGLLVLDDDVELGELIGELGKLAGFEPRVTQDITLFNEELGRESPDLIVLDLQMPDMDGVEVLRDLAARGVRASIVLVSGMDRRTIAGAERFGKQAGLNLLAAVQKPFEPESLIEILRSAKAATSPLTSSDLELAIANGELALAYQPVVRRIRSGYWHAESVEALVRWNHPVHGVLVPSQFLNLIDSDSGELMRHLTDFVFQRGVEQLKVWQHEGYHIGLRVNVAAGLISDAHFPDRLESLLHEQETDPGLLTLEIHEAEQLERSRQGSDILTRLRLKSINLSLDDFGTNGEPLTSLYRLPVSELKIHRDLIADIEHDSGARTMLRGLVAIARDLQLTCCAVGVETAGQLKLLSELGCDLAQGFHIGMPTSSAEILRTLAEWTVTSDTTQQAGGTTT